MKIFLIILVVVLFLAIGYIVKSRIQRLNKKHNEIFDQIEESGQNLFMQ